MLRLDKSPSRFDYIDALRGWAIVLVIIGHAATLTRLAGWPRTLADGALMGVHLFFVVSAFTIFHMLSKHVREEENPVRNFFIRRLFRIVPVYWFGILFYFLIWGILPQSKWWHYPVHLTLTNVLFPETQSSAVPGGWSISVEVLFYLSVPVWFKMIRNVRQAWTFVLVCVFGLPLITFGLKHWFAPLLSGIDAYWISVFWERFPTNSLGSFSFGILLFFLLKEERVTAWFQNKTTAWVVAVLSASMLGALRMFSCVYPLKAHFYCFFFMALALALAHVPWNIFVNPAMVFIGRVSYSMYLFHFAILTWWTKWAVKHMPELAAGQPLYFFLTILLTVAATLPLAWCGYQCIERPAMEWAKRLIVRLENRRRPES